MLWNLADLIERDLEELAELESIDNGKPYAVARFADLPLAVDMFRYMGGWATKITGTTIPLSLPGEYLSYTMKEPVGVVGQIIPNFPLLMAAWKIAPALSAGCTVVLKAAEQTPMTALRLGGLIQEAGFFARRRQHPHRVRRDRWRRLGRASRCRQGRIHRLDRGRQTYRAGGCRQFEESLAGAGRQVASNHLARC
jgi:Aldehyde dehydrogenase family